MREHLIAKAKALYHYAITHLVKNIYDHEILYSLGIAYYEKGDYDRAIKNYTTAIRIKPDFYEALSNRGVAYHNKSNYDRAIEDYNAAIRVKPDNEYALNNRGVAYADKGDYDRAIEDYNTALKIIHFSWDSPIKPDYHDALNNRGVVYSDIGDYDHAIEDFEAVLRIDPNNAKAREGLELARKNKGKVLRMDLLSFPD